MGIARKMKDEHGFSYASLAPLVGVSYPTLMRWNARRLSGGPVVREPGPAKTGRLDLGALDADIGKLGFGPRRCHGTGPFIVKYRDSISRRKLMALVHEAGEQVRDSRKASMVNVEWLRPRLAWGMDITEAAGENGTIYVNSLQDMASKWKFEPPALRHDPLGSEVAEQLDVAFGRFGPPLFLKRDNGGNLNSAAVDGVLERHMVIPFNSPAYYPQFNGSVENANGELKRHETFALMKNLGACFGTENRLYTYRIFGELNHKPREVLGGKCSCLAFHGSPKLSITRRDRKEIYDEILNRTFEIQRLSGNLRRDAVIRAVIKNWLLENGHIRMAVKEEVSPGSRRENVS